MRIRHGLNIEIAQIVAIALFSGIFIFSPGVYAAVCPKSTSKFEIYANPASWNATTLIVTQKRDVIPIAIDDIVTLTVLPRVLDSKLDKTWNTPNIASVSDWQSNYPQKIDVSPAVVQASEGQCPLVVISAPDGSEAYVLKYDPTSGAPTAVSRVDFKSLALSAGPVSFVRNQDIQNGVTALQDGLVVAALGVTGASEYVVDDEATVMAIWRDFLEKAKSSDELAKKYLLPAAANGYGGVAGTAELAATSAQVTDYDVLDLSGNMATIAMSMGQDGASYLFRIQMARANGHWKIMSF